MSKFWMAALGMGLALLGAGRVSAQGTFPFQDPSLPTAQRVDDLVSRMTLDGKGRADGDGRAGHPAPRAFPPIIGGANACTATPSARPTVFPEPIGLAATFDLSPARADRQCHLRRGPGLVQPDRRGGQAAGLPRADVFRARTSTSSATRAGGGGRRPTAKTRT